MSGFGDFFQGATQFAQTLSADFKEKKRKADERELLRKQLDFAALLDQQENNVRRQDFDETAYQNNQYYEDYQAWYDTQVDTMLKDVQDEELRERIEMSFRQMYQPSWNRVQATLENKADDKINADATNSLNMMATGGYPLEVAEQFMSATIDGMQIQEQDQQGIAWEYGTKYLSNDMKAQARKIVETEGIDAANAFINSYSTEIAIAGYKVTVGETNRETIKKIVAGDEEQRRNKHDADLSREYLDAYALLRDEKTGKYNPTGLNSLRNQLNTTDKTFFDGDKKQWWIDYLDRMIDANGSEPAGGTYGDEQTVMELTFRAYTTTESNEDFNSAVYSKQGLLKPQGVTMLLDKKQEQMNRTPEDMDRAERYISDVFSTRETEAGKDVEKKEVLALKKGEILNALDRMRKEPGTTGEMLLKYANTLVQDYVKLDFVATIDKTAFTEGTIDKTENFETQYQNFIAPFIYDSNGEVNEQRLNTIASVAGWKGATVESLKTKLDEIRSGMKTYFTNDIGGGVGEIEEMVLDPELHYPVGVFKGNKYLVRVVDENEAERLNGKYSNVKEWKDAAPIKNHEAWYVWDEPKQEWVYYKSLGTGKDGKANPAAVQEVSAINNPSGGEKYEEIEIGNLKPAEKIQIENKEAEITPAKQVEKQAAEEGKMELDGEIVSKKETMAAVETVATSLLKMPSFARNVTYSSYTDRPEFLDLLKKRVEELEEAKK